MTGNEIQYTKMTATPIPRLVVSLAVPTVASMFNNVLAAFLIRVPATWLFSRLPHATLFHIGFAAPCASIASIFIGLLYLKKGKWQKSNILGGNLQ